MFAHQTMEAFASLGCAWAAVTSIAIAAHLRLGGEHRSVAQAGV